MSTAFCRVDLIATNSSDTTPLSNTAKRLLADIRRNWHPDITSRAAEIDAGRRIPPVLMEARRMPSGIPFTEAVA